MTPEEEVMGIEEKVSCLVQGALERQMKDAGEIGYREGECDGEFNVKQNFRAALNKRINELNEDFRDCESVEAEIIVRMKIHLIETIREEI